MSYFTHLEFPFKQFRVSATFPKLQNKKQEFWKALPSGIQSLRESWNIFVNLTLFHTAWNTWLCLHLQHSLAKHLDYLWVVQRVGQEVGLWVVHGFVQLKNHRSIGGSLCWGKMVTKPLAGTWGPYGPWVKNSFKQGANQVLIARWVCWCVSNTFTDWLINLSLYFLWELILSYLWNIFGPVNFDISLFRTMKLKILYFIQV